MELTGGPFVALAITVTTVALITGAILTGRTRRTVWGAVQRALAMVLVAVLAVLSVAIGACQDFCVSDVGHGGFTGGG